MTKPTRSRQNQPDNPDEQKRCSKCGETKPRSEFYVKDPKSGRLFAWCRECHKKPQLNPRPVIVAGEPRVCSQCGAMKEDSEYRPSRGVCRDCEARYRASHADDAKVRWQKWSRENPQRNRAKSRRHYKRHQTEEVARARDIRAADPEKSVATVRKWQQANPEAHKRLSQRRRAREAGAEGDYTVEEWEALKARYEYTCLWCRRREPEIRLSPDHIVPLAKGGTSWIDNIQPLCAVVMQDGRRTGCQYLKNAKAFDLRPFWSGPLPETVEMPDGSLFALRVRQ